MELRTFVGKTAKFTSRSLIRNRACEYSFFFVKFDKKQQLVSTKVYELSFDNKQPFQLQRPVPENRAPLSLTLLGGAQPVIPL